MVILLSLYLITQCIYTSESDHMWLYSNWHIKFANTHVRPFSESSKLIQWYLIIVCLERVVAGPSCSAGSAIFCTGSIASTDFCGCCLRTSFFANYHLMQVLYTSPPRQASTATSFSDFRPARAQASLRLFSLFVFAFPCFAFVSL